MREALSTFAAIIASRMRRRLRLLLAPAHPTAPLPGVEAVSFTIEHQGVSFDVYRLERGEEQGLRFHWKRRNGRPYGTLSALRKELAAQGQRLAFAVNGGIFSRKGVPLGLYVEEGVIITPLNTGCGVGNFFRKPNGVFSISGQGAQVIRTEDYHPSGPVRQAVQSGPMLVIDGQLHPYFIPAYKSRLIRNGVGVDGEGRTVFAISDGVTNLHDFGTLFRDRLECPNALYLDGQVSRMYLPEMGYCTCCSWRPVATIIGLSKAVGKAP